MSRMADDIPEPMRAGGTELERRLLNAVAHEEPSEELSRRMATAIGLSSAALGAATAAKAVSTGAAKTAAGKGVMTVLWPWLSVGAIALVATGAVVGTRMGGTDSREARQPSSTAQPTEQPVPVASPAPRTDQVVPREAVVRPHANTTMVSRPRAPTMAGDLRDQIAMIDAARGAVTTGNGARALDVLRIYQEKYPAGSFRPEATALRIEALIKLGRKAEARSLAVRFVSEKKGTPLAERVARIAGLAAP